MINFVIPDQIKKIIIYAIIILGFILTANWAINKYQKTVEEKNRLDNVLKNINMEYAVTKAKNGELIYSMNALTVKGSELEIINKTLANSLSNLKLHYKDLQSVSNIQYRYITLLDSVPVATKLNKLKYQFKKGDNYSNITGYINLPKELFSVDSLVANNPKNYPYLTDLNFENKDSLLVIHEFQYRRHWIFWRKVTGVKVHVKSESPYFKIDKIESFQVIK